MLVRALALIDNKRKRLGARDGVHPERASVKSYGGVNSSSQRLGRTWTPSIRTKSVREDLWSLQALALGRLDTDLCHRERLASVGSKLTPAIWVPKSMATLRGNIGNRVARDGNEFTIGQLLVKPFKLRLGSGELSASIVPELPPYKLSQKWACVLERASDRTE